MTRAIKKENLERQVARLNQMGLGSVFHLDGAYGGWRLEEHLPNGGVQDAIQTGYVSKRELWNAIDAFKLGVSVAQRESV